jgi:hypothetical protein
MSILNSKGQTKFDFDKDTFVAVKSLAGKLVFATDLNTVNDKGSYAYMINPAKVRISETVYRYNFKLVGDFTGKTGITGKVEGRNIEFAISKDSIFTAIVDPSIVLGLSGQDNEYVSIAKTGKGYIELARTGLQLYLWVNREPMEEEELPQAQVRLPKAIWRLSQDFGLTVEEYVSKYGKEAPKGYTPVYQSFVDKKTGKEVEYIHHYAKASTVNGSKSTVKPSTVNGKGSTVNGKPSKSTAKASTVKEEEVLEVEEEEEEEVTPVKSARTAKPSTAKPSTAKPSTAKPAKVEEEEEVDLNAILAQLSALSKVVAKLKK